jgi:hypothetical protein
MFGSGDRHHTYSELPEPPYSLDVVADLHAGVYPDDVADVMRAEVLANPDSMAVWNALDATTRELASIPTVDEPLPAYAKDMVDRTLQSILGVRPAEKSSVTPLRPRRGRMLAAVGAAAAAIAAVAVATTFAFSDESAPPTAEREVPASITVPTDATLLSALGHSDTAAFADTARRDRCLAANEVSPTTPVLGTGSIEVGGGPAVVILLGTGKAGRLDALVVGADCDAANPATLSRTTIGNK